jgi:hypothetical protein
MIFAALQQKYTPKRIPVFLTPRAEDRGYQDKTPTGFSFMAITAPGYSPRLLRCNLVEVYELSCRSGQFCIGLVNFFYSPLFSISCQGGVSVLRFVMIFAVLQQKYTPKRIPVFLTPRAEDRGYQDKTPTGFSFMAIPSSGYSLRLL